MPLSRVKDVFQDLGNTEIYRDGKIEFCAPNFYKVFRKSKDVTQSPICAINFQNGPIPEHGINGVTIEDLLVICKDRLEYFQQSEFRCRENAIAITDIENAVMILSKRTLERRARGVEGTLKV